MKNNIVIKNIILSIFTLCIMLYLTSCNNVTNVWTGIGAAVDLEAPILTVFSPQNMDSVGASFVATGTVTDNSNIANVELTFYKNNEDGTQKQTLYGKAKISKENWSYTVQKGALESGEYTLHIQANDIDGNKSVYSSRTLVIIVDATPSRVEIIKPALLTKNNLEQLNHHNYYHLDYFQNKTFSLSGTIDDDYPISDFTITMGETIDSKNVVVYKKMINASDFESATDNSISGSVYNWNVKINSIEQLIETQNYTNKLGTLDNNKHFLQVSIIVHDKAGNECITGQNEDNNYLCLYQESDRPWSVISSLDETMTDSQQAEYDNASDENKPAILLNAQQTNNKLHSGATIAAVTYDDDQVTTVEYLLCKSTSTEPVMIDYNTKYFTTKYAIWQFQAPTNTGSYILYYRAKDINGTTSYGDNANNWTTSSGWDDAHRIGFRIVDESAPITEITPIDKYPESAYISNVNPKFEINGTTKDGSGVKEIFLAWDPSNDANNDTMLKNADWQIENSGWKNGFTTDTNIRYWVVDISSANISTANNVKTTKWNINLPINEFELPNHTFIYQNKKMYCFVRSLSGTYTCTTFNITRDNEEPIVTIETPQDGDEVRNVQGEHFTISGHCADNQSGIAKLSIQYNKLGLPFTQKIEVNDDGSWSITSDKLENLDGGYQKLILIATDMYNNVTRQTLSIKIDNDSPKVESISVDKESGYYTTGTVLTFSVTMSREVQVSGGSSPANNIRLKLNCNSDAYATFDSISSDNKTIVFKYTVKNSDNAEPLDYANAKSIVYTNNYAIKGKSAEASSQIEASVSLPEPGSSESLASRGIYIDTTKPTISNITTNVGSGAYKAGTNITISIQFNENISGRASLYLNSRAETSSNIISSEVVSDSDTLDFVYNVKSGDTATILDIAKLIPYSGTSTIRDNSGNELDFNSLLKGDSTGSLASHKIEIDTTEPTLNAIEISKITGSTYASAYYLNEGKTIEFTATFSEAVNLGNIQPTLTLNAENSSTQVQAMYVRGAGSSCLTFIYTINNGDNSPTSTKLTCISLNGDVQDKAGNKIAGSVSNVTNYTNALTFNNAPINVFIDTTVPTAPILTFKDSNNTEKTSSFTKTDNSYEGLATGYTDNLTVTASGESTAIMKMTAVQSGKSGTWEEISSYTTNTANAEAKWIIKAQLTDYAGNKSDISTATFIIDNGIPLLNSITTTASSGIYKKGSQIPIKLIFSKKVKNTSVATITFNNNGVATFATNANYSTMFDGVYTVGDTIGEVDTDSLSSKKLEISSISGGAFFDTTGNQVNSNNNYNLVSLASNNDFYTKNIQVDTTAPTITKYEVTEVNGALLADNQYFLNAEDILTIEITFSEAVNIAGDSSVTLSNSGNASYKGSKNNQKTLIYGYTVASDSTHSQDCSKIYINNNIYPTNVQDMAGNALANGMTKTELTFNSKSINVDTTIPNSPTVTLTKLNDTALTPEELSSYVSSKVKATIVCEANTLIEYSENSGSSYNTYSAPVELGIDGSQKTYYVVAKQTDRAGNISATSAKQTVTVNLKEMALSKITTTKADGTYKAGQSIPIMLLFTQKVSVSNLVLTLQDDNGTTITTNSYSQPSASLSHQINYEVQSTHNCSQLKVTAISGVFKDSTNSDVTAKISIPTDNFTGNNITLDTTAPTVTNVVIDTISDETHLYNSKYYLNSGKEVTITVTFSEKVTPIGTSTILLSSAEQAECITTGNSLTHTYKYVITNGNVATLTVNNVAPTNISDEANNSLTTTYTSGDLLYKSKKICIDTTSPKAPTISIVDANGTTIVNGSSTTTAITVTLTNNGETDIAQMQHSENAGGIYSPYSTPVTVGDVGISSTYKITAKQTDFAGNESVSASTITATVDLRTIGLKGISTTQTGGTYKAGVQIPLTIEFNKATKVVSGILTLNNGATVSFSCNDKTTCTANYTIGTSDASTTRLYVTKFSGTVTDTATNLKVTTFENVDGAISNGVVNGNISGGTNLPNVGDSGCIAIDTIIPTVSSISATGVTDSTGVYHTKDNQYYLNVGDTVTIEVNTSEAVSVTGSSELALSNGAKAKYSNSLNDNTTLVYTYTINDGDTNVSTLGMLANACPTYIQDLAGNNLTSTILASNLTYNSKTFCIDTIAPNAPTVIVQDSADYELGNNSTATSTIKVTVADIEPGASAEYTTNGSIFDTYTSTITNIGVENASSTYKISAKQTDIAGNTSVSQNIKTITVDLRKMGLKSVSTTKVGGIYKTGENIPLTLEFYKSTTITSGTLTLNNNATIPITCTAKTTVTVNYVIASNQSTDRLYATGFSGTVTDALTGLKVSSFENVSGTITNGVVNGNITGGTNLPALTDSGCIAVDTDAPTFTSIAVTSVSDIDHLHDSTYYLNANDTVTVKLTFSEKVDVVGDSTVRFTNNETANYTSGSGTDTLVYTYIIGSKDVPLLKIALNAYPSNLQDKAGNSLKTGLGILTELKYNSNSICIDTTAPKAPTISVATPSSIVVTSGNTTVSPVNITVANNGESQISNVELSTNAGSSFDTYMAAVTVGENKALTTYRLIARQTDYAGNVSPNSSIFTVNVDLRQMGLKAITTTKIGGTYKSGEQIPIVIEFYKSISITNGVLTFNNGESATFTCNNKTNCATTYTIISASTPRLYATGFYGEVDASITSFDNVTGTITSGVINGTIDSVVQNLPKTNENGCIAIDTTAPTLTNIQASNISDKTHVDSTAYYLNSNDTVSLILTFDESVDVVGESVLQLDTTEDAIYTSGSGSKTLVYTYTVASGNTTALTLKANIYPTNLQDKAGNSLVSGFTTNKILKYNSKNIYVDTVAPSVPTITYSPNVGNNSSTNNDVTITLSGESSSTLQYSTNGGSTYNTYSSAVTLGEENAKTTYKILAKQIDFAGNESTTSTQKTITIDKRILSLESVTSTKLAGTYTVGEVIPLTLVFNKKVTITNGKLVMNIGESETFNCTNQSTVTTTYTVKAGDNCLSLIDQGLSGTLTDVEASATVSASAVYSRISRHLSSGIVVDTTAPNVTNIAVTSVSTNSTYNGNYYLNKDKTVTIAITSNEVVNITGSSTLALSNGAFATYLNKSADNKTLTYVYTITNEDENESLSITANTAPTNVADIAGNELISSLTTNVLTYSSKGIIVDTICNPPTLTGLTANKQYYTGDVGTATVNGETGATFYISTDGGATATQTSTFSTSSITKEGTYRITAKQIDVAGNESLFANSTQIYIDNNPPVVKSITTTKADGVYGAGSVLTISVGFSEPTTGTLTVSLNSGATVTLSPSSETSATTEYVVQNGENATVLSATSITGTITDELGNSSSSHSEYENFESKNVKIDTTAPTITKYKVDDIEYPIATQHQGVSVSSQIVLQFDEEVLKNSGTITIDRVYKSYPAIMDVDTYQAHKSSMSSYYIQRCIGTVGNDGVTPDTDAQYVLNYSIDHGSFATNSGLTGDQLTVYNYFATGDGKAYNTTVLDIASGNITLTRKGSAGSYYTEATITPPTELAQGIEYNIIVSAGAFLDKAGNKVASSDDIKFETGPTAVPVIRIDKQSGAAKYSVEAKISTETHDGTVWYGKSLLESNNDVDIITASSVSAPTITSTGDTNQSEQTLACSNDYNAGIFKLQAYTEKAGLTTGETYKEVAFKTVIWGDGAWGFRGSDSTGGVSATSEFPMNWYSDPETARCNNVNMFSWHILKDFQFKAMKSAGTYQDGNASNTKGYVGCKNKVGVNHNVPKAATPVITFSNGTVTITCSTTNATIYYTTDGSEPNASCSVYSSGISKPAGTVKAVAIASGMDNSDVATKSHLKVYVKAPSWADSMTIWLKDSIKEIPETAMTKCSTDTWYKYEVDDLVLTSTITYQPRIIQGGATKYMKAKNWSDATITATNGIIVVNLTNTLNWNGNDFAPNEEDITTPTTVPQY